MKAGWMAKKMWRKCSRQLEAKWSSCGAGDSRGGGEGGRRRRGIGWTSSGGEGGRRRRGIGWTSSGGEGGRRRGGIGWTSSGGEGGRRRRGIGWTSSGGVGGRRRRGIGWTSSGGEGGRRRGGIGWTSSGGDIVNQPNKPRNILLVQHGSQLDGRAIPLGKVHQNDVDSLLSLFQPRVAVSGHIGEKVVAVLLPCLDADGQCVASHRHQLRVCCHVTERVMDAPLNPALIQKRHSAGGRVHPRSLHVSHVQAVVNEDKDSLVLHDGFSQRGPCATRRGVAGVHLRERVTVLSPVRLQEVDETVEDKLSVSVRVSCEVDSDDFAGVHTQPVVDLPKHLNQRPSIPVT